MIELKKKDFSCWGNEDKYDDELIIEHDPKIFSRDIADQILQDHEDAKLFNSLKDVLEVDDKSMIMRVSMMNKGDAEKYREVKDGTLGFIRAFNWLDKNEISKIPDHPENEKNRQIVKRLEDKLKECKENAGGMEFGLELEKILKGENNG